MFNQCQVHCRDSAIIDVHHDHVKPAISCSFEEDHLVNIAVREPKFTNEDFDKLLVPASATLLQSIQGLD